MASTRSISNNPLGPSGSWQRPGVTSRLPARKPVPSSNSNRLADGPNVLVKRKPAPSKIVTQPVAQRKDSAISTSRRPSNVSPAGPDPYARDRPRRLSPEKGNARVEDGYMLIQPPSRIGRFDNARTPSLVSGSSVTSTADSPKANLLRHKASNIGKATSRESPDSAAARNDLRNLDPLTTNYEDMYSDSVLGIAFPTSSQMNKSPDVIQLDQFIGLPGNPLDYQPPPTPLYALTGTPSTGYSPGPFSVSSTPTTMTSYSPAPAVAPIIISPVSRQKSPVKSRPPTSRRLGDSTMSSTNPKGLAPVRESSSSSTSTLKDRESPHKGSGSSTIRHNVASRAQPVRGKEPGRHASGSAPQRPPEFAYLRNAQPKTQQPPPVRTMKPVRPSRDNTPEINFRELSPVIQSNMSSLPPSFHHRQGSADSRRLAPITTSENKSRFGLPRKQPSRNPSPSPVQSALSPPSRGLTPDPASDNERSRTTQPSPSTDKPQARFGFFSKKPKPDQPTGTTSREKQRLRKGPVAGTGHEGYGKFALRGRSGSTTSGSGNVSVGRSSSVDSTGAGNVTHPSSRKSSIGSKAGSDVDDFLAERLTPITLRGNGPDRPTMERSKTEPVYTTSGHRRALGSADVDPISPLTTTGPGAPRPTLLPSVFPEQQQSASAVKDGHRGHTTSNSGEQKASRFGLSNLASRRVSRRSLLDDKASAAIHAKLNEEFVFPSHPAINPLDRKMSEPTPVLPTVNDFGENESKRGTTVSKLQAREPKLSRKWNFFQKAKGPAKKEADAPVLSLPRQIPPRSVAHYAMIDAPGTVDPREIEAIMLEAEEEQEKEFSSEEKPDDVLPVSKHGNSILLPEPPPFIPEFATLARSSSPKVMLQLPQRTQTPDQPPSPDQDEAHPTESSQQPRPRLAQVGRIPRVVSKRDRERNLSYASFSRPFDRSRPSPAMHGARFIDEPLTESPDLSTEANPSPLLDSTTVPTSSSASKASPLTSLDRQDSDCSATSTDSASIDKRQHSEPSAPTLDEVWNEYDDLLDSFAATQAPKTPLTGSSFGAPFQYAEFNSPADERFPLDLLTKTPPVPSVPAIAKKVRFPSSRESQLLGPTPSNFAPASPSVSEILGAYENRTPGVPDSIQTRMSLPSSGRLSSRSSRFSLPASVTAPQKSHRRSRSMRSSGESNPPLPRSKRDSLNIQKSETEHMGFESMANLRFGALMTSKWLSFGRVLFSPAHFEINKPEEYRILILDGLGKDWSFYVALTYPNASVYNLGDEPVDTKAKNMVNDGFQSPQNHRHIYHPNMSSPFPFPKGFFAAVVFRFPIATTESYYRFTISECKRVLRPGGYLEVSALDIDMLNMGSLTRRAVRNLKVDIQNEDSNISLKPISDTVQKLLGRRGFENLNRCLVGVPAAGRIPSSRDGSLVQSPNVDQDGAPKAAGGRPDLGELFRDQSSQGDDGITQMVAKVARWWYSRCYESLVLPDGDISQSIWMDEAVLKECEQRGTNLRLMVCFAQKPECAVRRTISV